MEGLLPDFINCDINYHGKLGMAQRMKELINLKSDRINNMIKNVLDPLFLFYFLCKLN